ncbi:hypothetical protein A2947_00185 [Candidatus Peribacteria bacterium RIFCSPLOWO2_01_FULL_54_110]|nr:MAG: hypothetical protein A2947_00185 [Candidatus Peribacteria bacterium RIFCSPLOWO2_01_FULL_54_110]
MRDSILFEAASTVFILSLSTVFRIASISKPMPASFKNRSKVADVMMKPLGTGNPTAMSSPSAAPFPPTVMLSFAEKLSSACVSFMVRLYFACFVLDISLSRCKVKGGVCMKTPIFYVAKV